MTTESKKSKSSPLETLEVWWSRGRRVLFVRMTEEDKDDDSLVALYRLLEMNNIDTERAMSRFGQLRAMKLPPWIEPTLKQYYNLEFLTDKEIMNRIKPREG